MNTSPNVNLSNLKRTLIQNKLEKEQQGSTDQVHEGNVILYAMNALDRNWVNVSDDYLKRAYNKQLKIDKHKTWKKRQRERKKHQQQKIQLEDTAKSEQPTINTVKIEKKTIPKTHKQEKRIQQLSIVVEKLVQLRNLRRKKLEAKGHFFPDTGDNFYNKIKAAEEEHDDNDKEEDLTPRTIQPHPDDRWFDEPLDMNAYNFWLQGWTGVDQLRRIRQEWDQYLVDSVSSKGPLASKIPPTMVTPSPPSSHGWEIYLK